MDKNKKIMPVLIPLVVAIIVVIGFAVSGNITKNADDKDPTADTKVSAVNVTDENETQKTTSGTSKVTMVAVGDNLIHNTLIAAGEQQDGSLNYSSFYSKIEKYVKSADIAVINQETILGGDAFEYTGYPTFNTPWEVADAAREAGFDVFTCATNHSMDMGSAGVEKELEYFSKHKEVVHLGTNASEDDYNKITYYEKNGITFAMLNYTFGTNGIDLPGDKPWLVNLMDKEKITKDLKEARKNADVVVVFPHWGTEYSTSVSDYQKEYTKLFLNLGVDIVIGCHPHVMESVQWYTNEKTGKKMIVYYSLGNFISHQLNLENLCGGMAELTITKNNDKIEVTSAKLAPVVTWYSNGSGKYQFVTYKLSDYNDELASSQKQDGATVKYFTDLSKKIVSDEFLDLK